MLGAINWDVSIFEERFARPGEEVPVRLVEEFSGGKGANVASAAARILGRGRVAFVGALGDDEVSGMQLGVLRQEGVATDGVIILKGRRSGRAYIIVDREGRKTIHTHFGANEGIRPRHLATSGPSRALKRSSMVVLMDVPLPVAARAARAANESGAVLLYSPGVRSREGMGNLEGVVRASDFLVVDTHELRNLGGSVDEDSCLDTLRGTFPSQTIVATLGERGCVIAKGGATTRVGGVVLAALGKKAVNSTGSGDAFLGVFASHLLMGMSPASSALWANLAGALKATKYETRGSPRLRELEDTMKRLERLKSSGLGLDTGSPKAAGHAA